MNNALTMHTFGININIMHKILLYSILALLVVYFIGLLELMPETYGLNKPLLDIPIWLEVYWDYIPLAILILSVLDITFKYKQLKSFKLLLKNHFLDILMVTLLPFLLIFKIAKLSYKLYKLMKVTKSWTKLAHLIKKIKAYKNNYKNTQN